MSDYKAEQEEPFFTFPKLKQKLTDMGVEIGVASAYTPIKPVDVLPEDIGTRIFIEDEGIFYLDNNGIKRRGFMYKKSFYFEWQGQQYIPKFHTCKCSVISYYGRDQYCFANSEPVMIYSKNSRRNVQVEGMQLCGYCSEKMKECLRTSTDFVEILKEAGDVGNTEDLELDFYGYVKNWEQISLAYRTKKDFTCERCGIKIENGFDRQFIHTHHKNGDKTDNRESNLECLCIKCHSNIDEAHKRNFSKGGNKVLLDEFENKY